MWIIIYSCCWRWGEGKAQGWGYIRRTGRGRDGVWREAEVVEEEEVVEEDHGANSK